MNLSTKIFTGLIFTGILFTVPGVNLIVPPAAVAQGQNAEELSAEAERLFQEGIQLSEQGTAESLQQAMEKWKQALQLFRSAADRRGEAKTLGNIGIIYSSLGEQEAAITYLNQALELSEAENNIPNQITSLVRLGLAHHQLKQFLQSISYYDRALTLLRNTGEKAKEAHVLAEIASAYHSLRNFPQAIAYNNQALSLYEAEQDLANAANILKVLGLIYQSLGNNEQAIEQYEKALEYWQKINSQSDVATTLRFMGDVTGNLGNYQQAIDYYNQALAIWQEMGQKPEAAQVAQVTGQIYQQLGDIERILSYQNQALSLWKELKDLAGQAQMLSEIGLTYYAKLDDSIQALSYYEQAVTLWQQLNQPVEEAKILNLMGSIYSESENYQQAQEYLTRSLQLLQGQKLPRYEADTLLKIAKVYSLLGDNNQALTSVNRGMAIAESLPETEFGFKAIAFSRAGNIYYLLNNYEAALKYHNQALQIWQTTKDYSNEAFEWAILAEIERDRGNLNQSLDNIESAIEIVENLRRNIINPDLRQSYFSTVQDYYELKIDLLMQLHQKQPNQGYDAQALQTSENSRARVLTELLTEANLNIREGVDPNLLAEEKSLNQQLSAKEKQRQDLVSASYNQSDLDKIKAEIDGILKQLSELETKIRQNSPTYANLKYPQALSLAEIQDLLDEDTLLLEYALGQERSYLFLVGKNIFQVHQIPAADEIESAIEAYLELLKSPSQTNLSDGEKLSEMLLYPIADQLDKQRLIIVGNGKLQLLPFAALPISNSGGEGTGALPLLVNHEIISLPSFTSIAVQREEWQKRPPAAKTLAVLADPIFNANDPRIQGRVASNNQELADIIPGIRGGCSSLNRLPYTAEEANNILAQVADNQEFSALGFDATRAQAINPNLQDYKMLHLATHGCIEDNLLLSGLAFSRYDQSGNTQDSFLRLQDIFNLRLNAKLVVLSACETGTGDNVNGEGIVGLTRGFMYAGARRVLVSLWAVNDAATANLMDNFYKKMLQENLSPAAALRAAQLEMWQEENWRSPYYWAAFTIQGDW